ncbi:MAG TPA: trigger factor [Bacteroidales bacterium]|nr:trigger factor [Bacteroidales bacterium]
MKSTLNTTNEVNGTIVIELEKADYQEKVEKSLSQFRRKAQLPGFRQGKVPKSVIQKMYGKAILVDEVNKLVTDELSRFLRENNLKILGEPMPDESEDKQVDLEKDDPMTFYFNVALTPEFELPVSELEVTRYNVQLEPELLDKQIQIYQQNYGSYLSIEEEAVDTDLIKGTLTEWEGDAAKEDGRVVENAILMPSYVKDEAVKNSFIGTKVGDHVLFNPMIAYDNNEAEVASLLQDTKEGIKGIDSDFRFDIAEVTRYKEAELDQELFNKVLGEGAADSEEQFREKVEAMMIAQFKPNVDHLFIHEARDLIVEKMSDVLFPDELLKKWLLTTDENRTPEEVEEDYPAILEDLKFHVAKQKIVDENDIKVEVADVEAMAVEVARAQFAQYGMTNLPADALQNYAQRLLEKEETVRSLYQQATENKLIEWLMENVTLVEKNVTTKEFGEIVEEHSRLHAPEELEEDYEEGLEEGFEENQEGVHGESTAETGEISAENALTEEVSTEEAPAEEVTVEEAPMEEATTEAASAEEATEKEATEG